MSLILLIDDDEFYCRIMERELGDAGYAVVTAQTRAEGIARFRELSPDLVITDMRMPEIDGAEVIGGIRAIDKRARIIAVSSAATFYSIDFIKLAKEVGADAVVRKLDPMERIIIEVQALLNAAASKAIPVPADPPVLQGTVPPTTSKVMARPAHREAAKLASCAVDVPPLTWRQIVELYGLLDAVAPNDFGPCYNIAPTQYAPVVRERDGRREYVMLRWGLIPFWAKDPKIAYKTINARSETVATAPSFRGAFKARRCLIPTSGFYEWQKTPDGKQPYLTC